MNDLDARVLRPLARRTRRLVGRDSSGARLLQGWASAAGGLPVRYSLHGLALAVGLSAAVWSASAPPARVMEQPRAMTLAETSAPELIATPAPPPTPTPAPTPAPTAAPTRPFSYTVQPGDTLRALADRFGISLQTLVWNNQISNPDLLRVGQELVVLPVSGVLHTVQPGETLRQIAARYEVPLSKLVRSNELADPDALVPGMQLVVPGGRPPVERAAPAPQRAEPVAESSPLVAMAELRPLPAAETAQEPPAFAPSPPTPTPKPKPSTVLYEVKPGDTINLLTQLFGVDLQTILDANDIADADLIRVGTQLRIPPVSGVEHEVAKGETLADIARAYEVDMGPILDFNDLPNPDVIQIGMKLLIPGGKKPRPAPPPAPPPVAVARPAAAPAAAQVAPPRPARPAPPPPVTGSGPAIVKNALAYQGYPYVWGGTSPAGFDCSGFVYYIYRISGRPVPRSLWGQLNAGPRVAAEHLEPGDIVFFANTYMPGLSHNGVYIGGGRFIHASDPSTGVTISSMSSSYWASRYVGASRP